MEKLRAQDGELASFLGGGHGDPFALRSTTTG